MQIGIQVSSFKPVLKNETQVRAACEKMAAMGCRLVQLQWIDPSVSGEFVARSLGQAGIESVGVQDFYVQIRENPDYYIGLNRATGGKWMCVSRIPEEMKSPAGIGEYVAELRKFQEKLDTFGQILCFHPVTGDFEKKDGTDLVQTLLDAMPELMICADLYHLARSVEDVPGWLRKYAGRVCMVHFKEGRGGDLVPLGQGDGNWTGVVEACLETGVAYAFAEQERWAGDPFERLKESFDWLNGQIS